MAANMDNTSGADGLGDASAVSISHICGDPLAINWTDPPVRPIRSRTKGGTRSKPFEKVAKTIDDILDDHGDLVEKVLQFLNRWGWLVVCFFSCFYRKKAVENNKPKPTPFVVPMGDMSPRVNQNGVAWKAFSTSVPLVIDSCCFIVGLVTSNAIEDEVQRQANRGSIFLSFVNSLHTHFGGQSSKFIQLVKPEKARKNQSDSDSVKEEADFIEQIVELDQAWESARVGEARYHLDSLIAVASIVPFLWKQVSEEGLTGLVNGMKKSMSKTKDDIIGKFISGLRFFVIEASVYLFGEEYSLKHKNNARKIDTINSHILAAYERRKNGDTSMTAEEALRIEMDGRLAVNMCIENSRTCSSVSMREVYRRRGAELSNVLNKFVADLNENKMRVPGFVIQFVGPPGCGKSGSTNFTLDCLHAADSLTDFQRTSFYSPRDKYDSMARSTTTAWIADDPMQNPDPKDNNFCLWLIEFKNANATPLIMPEAGDKGMHFNMARYCVVTNNEENPDVSKFVAEPMAYFRRFDITVRFKPNKNVMKNGRIDPERTAKYRINSFPEFCKYDIIQHYESDGEVKVRVLRKDMTHSQIQPYIVSKYEEYKKREEQILAVKKKPREICPIHNRPLDGCPCQRTFESKMSRVKRLGWNKFVGVQPWNLKEETSPQLAKVRLVNKLFIEFRHYYGGTGIEHKKNDNRPYKNFLPTNRWVNRHSQLCKAFNKTTFYMVGEALRNDNTRDYADNRLIPIGDTFGNMLGIPDPFSEEERIGFMKVCEVKAHFIQEFRNLVKGGLHLKCKTPINFDMSIPTVVQENKPIRTTTTARTMHCVECEPSRTVDRDALVSLVPVVADQVPCYKTGKVETLQPHKHTTAWATRESRNSGFETIIRKEKDVIIEPVLQTSLVVSPCKLTDKNDPLLYKDAIVSGSGNNTRIVSFDQPELEAFFVMSLSEDPTPDPDGSQVSMPSLENTAGNIEHSAQVAENADSRVQESGFNWRSVFGHDHALDKPFPLNVCCSVVLSNLFYDAEFTDDITSDDFWMDVARFRRHVKDRPPFNTLNEEAYVVELSPDLRPGCAVPTVLRAWDSYKEHVLRDPREERVIGYLHFLWLTSLAVDDATNNIRQSRNSSLTVLSNEVSAALFETRINEGFDVTTIGNSVVQKYCYDLTLLSMNDEKRGATQMTLAGLSAGIIMLTTWPLIGAASAVSAGVIGGSGISLALTANRLDETSLLERTETEEWLRWTANGGFIAGAFFALKWLLFNVKEERIKEGIGFLIDVKNPVLSAAEMKKKIKQQQKPKSWAKVEQSLGVRLAKSASTSTYEQTLAKIRNNLYHTEFIQGGKKHTTTALFINTQYFVVAGHVWDNVEQIEGVMRSNHTTLCFDVSIQKCDGMQVPGTDLWIGIAPVGVGHVNLIDYFPETTPVGECTGTMLLNINGFSQELECFSKFMKTYSDASCGKFHGTESEVSSPTKGGYCGSPIVCMRGKNGFIGSLHVARDAVTGKAVGATLLKPQIMLLLQHLHDKIASPVPNKDMHRSEVDILAGKKIDSAESAPRHPANFSYNGNAIRVSPFLNRGKFEKNRMVPHSNRDAIDVFKTGARGPAPFTKADLWGAIQALGASAPPGNLSDVTIVADELSADLCRYKPPWTGVISFDQALYGDPGLESVDGAQMNTGAGPGFDTVKSTVIATIGVEKLEEMTMDVIEKCKEGEYAGVVYGCARKEEVRDEGKGARTFTPGSFHQHLALVMYGASTIAYMHHHNLDVNIAMGIDPQSPMWELLYRKLLQFGDSRIHASDYSSFDRSIPMVVKNGAVRVIANIARHTGLDESQVKTLESMLHETMEYTVEIRGALFATSIGQCSGNYYTALLNCVCSMILRRLSFRKRFPDLRYRDYVYDCTLGDDVIASVSKDVDWTCKHLKEDLEDYGVTVTSPDKDELKEFYHIDDAVFLQRKFSRPEGCSYIVGAINPRCIFSNKDGVLPSTAVAQVDQEKAACESALHLAWPNGPLVYEVTADAVKRYATQCKGPLGFDVLSYSMMVVKNTGSWNTSIPSYRENPWDHKKKGPMDWFKDYFDQFNKGPPDREKQSGVEENVEFLEAENDIVVEEGERERPDRSLITTDTYDLDSFYSRPAMIYKHNINNPTFTADINPWRSYFQTPQVWAKVQTYALFTGQLKLKIVVSSNKFIMGALICSYSPIGTLEDSTYEYPKDSLTLESQKPHVIMRMGEDSEGEMLLPFAWPDPAIALRNNNAFDLMGDLTIQVFSPIQAIAGSSIQASIRVYAHLENYTFSGTTRVNQMKLSSVLGAVSSTAGKVAKLPIGPMATVSDVVSSVTDGLGSAARAMGWSRPLEGDNKVYTHRYGGFMATGDTNDVVAPLSATMTHEHSVDPRLMGHGEDEMLLSTIAAKDGFIGSFVWSTDDTTDTVLAQIPVYPVMSTVYSPGDATNHPWLAFIPSAVAAYPFAHWRGTANITFHIFSTTFHGGQLMISHDPFTMLNPTETLAGESWICDVGVSREITVEIPWRVEEGLLRLGLVKQMVTDGQASVDASHDNGIVQVAVMNRLNVNSDVTETVNIAVTMSFPDLFLSLPTPIEMRDHEMIEPPGGARRRLANTGKWSHPIILQGGSWWNPIVPRTIGKEFTMQTNSESEVMQVILLVYGVEAVSGVIEINGVHTPVTVGLDELVALHTVASLFLYGNSTIKIRSDVNIGIAGIWTEESLLGFEYFMANECGCTVFLDTNTVLTVPSGAIGSGPYFYHGEPGHITGATDFGYGSYGDSYDEIVVTGSGVCTGFALLSQNGFTASYTVTQGFSSSPHTLENAGLVADALRSVTAPGTTVNMQWNNVPQVKSEYVTGLNANVSHADAAKIYSGEIVDSTRLLVKRYYPVANNVTSSIILPLYPMPLSTYPTPFAWYASCFFAVRGNMRFKGALNGYGKAGMYSADHASYFQGVQVAKDEMLMVQAPAYLTTKFVLLRTGNWTPQDHYRIKFEGNYDEIYCSAGEDISFGFYLGPPLLKLKGAPTLAPTPAPV